MADITSILTNLSQQMQPFVRTLSGLGFVVGICFVFRALMQLRGIADARASGGSHESIFSPLTYLLVAAMLMFLPDAMRVLNQTVFGTTNILQYTHYRPLAMKDIIKKIIQLAGVIWFIRGSVLMAHGNAPGGRHAGKGLAFLFAGVAAINFDGTGSFLEYMMNTLQKWSGKILPP